MVCRNRPLLPNHSRGDKLVCWPPFGFIHLVTHVRLFRVVDFIYQHDSLALVTISVLVKYWEGPLYSVRHCQMSKNCFAQVGATQTIKYWWQIRIHGWQLGSHLPVNESWKFATKVVKVLKRNAESCMSQTYDSINDRKYSTTALYNLTPTRPHVTCHTVHNIRTSLLSSILPCTTFWFSSW